MPSNDKELYDFADRRQFLQLGAAAGTLSVAALLGCAKSPQPIATTGPHMDKITYFSQFGIDTALIGATLGAALAKGGDRADVFVQHKVTRSLALEDGAVNRAFSGVELGAGVRVVKGDQTGYGYTEDLTAAGLRAAALTAATIADGPSRPGPTTFHLLADVPARYRLGKSWADVQPTDLLPILMGLHDQALRADPRIQKVSCGMSSEHGAMLLADSLGRIVEDLQPMTTLYLSCTAEHKGQRESNGYNVAGRNDVTFYSEERLKRVVDQAVGRTLILFDAVAAPAGEMPVVMAAGSSGILLHEAIGHGMEADFNRKGTSIYATKLGKPVAKPFVNIVDDGTIHSARGAINVDDEGNVAGMTHLVHDGVLTTYLHDSISAKHYGVAPTGNGRRESYKYAPMPRMRATYMLPGPHKKDEIIASVKKGIYCQNFSNGQVRIGGGDFTFYVKNGWLIEDGKLTRPIKDVNVIGNGPKVLEAIDMVSDDLHIDEGGWTCGKNGQSVPVSQGMPTVRVAQLTVGGAKKS